jgi:uncharacterized protein
MLIAIRYAISMTKPRQRSQQSQQHRLSARRVVLAALLGINSVSGCAWIDTRQRAAVYRPDRRVPPAFRGLLASDESFSVVCGSGTERGPLVMWWLPHADRDAPAVLYLHGTFRNLYHNHPKMEALRTAGFSVLAVEYRGWGDSAPILPSEATIYEDTELAWAELCRREPRALKRAIFGHSMGTGAATYLAERLDAQVPLQAVPQAALLVVESSFTRLIDVARSVSAWGYPLAWFATQEFDSLTRIARVKIPILFLHGSLDRTVPIELGRKLFEVVKSPKEFVEFPEGTHSELHTEDPVRYQRALRNWSQKLRRQG